MKRFSFLFLSPFLFALSALPSHAAATSGELIRASQPTVYYSYGGKRYAFPNEQVYFSWYKDFSTVKTVSDAELAVQTLSGNAQFKQGTLVKITTDPKVYLVTGGNEIRLVPSESYAVAAFGNDWAKKVKDVSDADFQNYMIVDPLATNKSFSAYYSSIYSLADAIEDSEAHAEQVPAQDRSMIPPNATDLQETKYGFDAKTTMSLDEVRTWFTSKIGEANLYDDSKTITTGTETYVIKFANRGEAVGDTFRHRSWVYLKTGIGNIISYADITFPKGLISYPRAVNQPTYIHTEINDTTNYKFDTLDSPDQIVAWYKENGAKYGWNLTSIESASDRSLGIYQYDLRNDGKQMEIIMAISETGVSRQVEIAAAPIGKFVIAQ